MIALSVAKLKMFLWIKPKKKKKFFFESLDQCRRLEVRENARNVFCDEPVRLSDHKVLHNIASSSSFFRFRSDFLAFFAHISYFKFLEFKEFNNNEAGYSHLGATPLVSYLPSHI